MKCVQTQDLQMFGLKLRGLVKLTKIPKSEKNSDWPAPTHTHPPLSIFYIFLNHVQQTKQHKKHNISKKSELGLDPLPEFFSDFWIFFNLTKSLSKYE